jgi:hypothetical protein
MPVPAWLEHVGEFRASVSFDAVNGRSLESKDGSLTNSQGAIVCLGNKKACAPVLLTRKALYVRRSSQAED